MQKRGKFYASLKKRQSVPKAPVAFMEDSNKDRPSDNFKKNALSRMLRSLRSK